MTHGGPGHDVPARTVALAAGEGERFNIIGGGVRVLACEAGSLACAPRGSVHAFRNIGTGLGRLLITCTPAGLEVPFRAVRDPEPGSSKPAMTPEQVAAEFARHGITFLGPPLSP